MGGQALSPTGQVNGVLEAQVGHSCHQGLVQGPGRASPNATALASWDVFLEASRLELSRQGASMGLPGSDKQHDLSREKQASEWSWSPAWRGWDRELLRAFVRVCILSEGQAARQLVEVMVAFETLRKAADSVCRKAPVHSLGCFVSFCFVQFRDSLACQDLLALSEGDCMQSGAGTGLRGAEEPSFEVQEGRHANLSSAAT